MNLKLEDKKSIMKKIMVLLVLLCTVQGFAQEVAPKEDMNIYNLAALKVKPEFPGGIKALNALVNERYLKSGFASEVKGRVYAIFVVEKDGSLSDIKILRGLDLEKAKTLISILKDTPKWTPGQQGEQTVRVLYSVALEIGG
jgi:protein TonB